MQAHDLPCTSTSPNQNPDLPTTMSDHHPSSPIPSNSSPQNTHNNHNNTTTNTNNNKNNFVKRERPSRACTVRSAARLYAAAEAQAQVVAAQRKRKTAARKTRLPRPPKEEGDEVEESPPHSPLQCSRVVTELVVEPEASQLPRWTIRSMWELASVLNFLNVFRPLLNINVEFSAEELETALITPNNTLGDLHIPLLKAIPPIARMAHGHNTWVTVLCRKLRDWWHWVADGELPIVASHGAEVEAYNALDPGVRVVILKALCDIRVEQEDIRNYIDDSVKRGVHLSAFRKERIGGDSHGISYWYEDDPIIGHRLYREIRKMEVKKGKGKNVQPILNSAYGWETVATSLDEFQDVSEKLFSSTNRTEASLGKKLKINMLSEIEKVQKRKEKLLKKQHRQALLLDGVMSADGFAAGRSLRDRKPVTYTFDDYDRSISEAIKITKKKQLSPEPNVRRDGIVKLDASTNGSWGGPSQIPHVSFNSLSPRSPDSDEMDDEDHKPGSLDRSNRRRQRPQRYSVKDFIESVSDSEADFDSDDDIVGEVVYDDEYLRSRKRRKTSSSSEGDEEYHWNEENVEDEDEEEEEEEEEDSSSTSAESDQPRRFKKLPGRTRRETKLRSVVELQSGLRRSKRATKNRINYRQYELSESETESMKPEKSNGSNKHTDVSDNAGFSMGSEDSEGNNDNQEMKIDQPVEKHPVVVVETAQNQRPDALNSPVQDEFEGVRKRRFLDLNELAPSSGFDDGPDSMMKDEDTDDF